MLTQRYDFLHALLTRSAGKLPIEPKEWIVLSDCFNGSMPVPEGTLLRRGIAANLQDYIGSPGIRDLLGDEGIAALIGKLDQFSSLDCLAIWYRTQCFWDLPEPKRNERFSEWQSGIDPPDSLDSGVGPEKAYHDLYTRFATKVETDPQDQLHDPAREVLELERQGRLVSAALLMQRVIGGER
jgi:hypothetical protein